MINRQRTPEITQQRQPYDFSKIKVGVKSLEDATLIVGDKSKDNPQFAKKSFVLNAIKNKDYQTLSEISNYYFRVSGIYSRLCRYLAYLYRYDWFVTPYQIADNVKTDKLLNDFNKILQFLEHFSVKQFFGEVALKVVINGCYYGYLVRGTGSAQIQELPIKYCRTRFEVNGKPAIEFQMKYFDDMFKDINQRIKMLNLFPVEFRKGYQLYKEGKLPAEFTGDQAGWYLLDVEAAFKFNIADSDQPILIAVIPALIDLDNAQDMDRQRMAQQLLKIIIQKMPLDKNGDMIFDMDEMAEMHQNAVNMIGKSKGLDILTTLADVDVEDVADNNTNTATDDLERVERAVYNEAGISQMQFNTDGNIALEKSILNDEATMYNLITKFEDFLNLLISPYNKKPKVYYFQAQVLPTTIYNYKEMAKLYKEQTQLGYSKMLPQIALGQTQSSILATAYFENDVLELSSVFIPPLMSSVMNADAIGAINKSGKTDKTNSDSQNGEKGGRPQKEEGELSEKTMQNKESEN